MTRRAAFVIGAAGGLTVAAVLAAFAGAVYGAARLQQAIEGRA